MREIIELATQRREEPIDITDRVRVIVGRVGIRGDRCAVYAQGATGATLIRENGDASVPVDVRIFCTDLRLVAVRPRSYTGRRGSLSGTTVGGQP